MEKNENLIKWLKIVAIFIYALLTIATCSAVWNSKPGAFLSIVAAVLLAVNGYVIYLGVKWL